MEKLLEELFKKYMATLDDNNREEYYETNRGLAARAFEDFMEWYKNETARPKGHDVATCECVICAIMRRMP